MSEENARQSEENGISSIEQQIIQVDPNLLKGLPKDKQHQLIRTVISIIKSHSGPLPDGETLRQYADIIPNGADRVMKMAEDQLKHRMYIEKKVVGGQLLQSNIGQFLAFFIGIGALGSATYCIVSGYELSGSIVGIGGLTSLVTAFIKGKSYQKRNLSDKKPGKK